MSNKRKLRSEYRLYAGLGGSQADTSASCDPNLGLFRPGRTTAMIVAFKDDASKDDIDVSAAPSLAPASVDVQTDQT